MSSLFGGEPKPWAIFSECKRYRYVLAWPTGLDDERYALFILANPSTATAEQTDPTVARCISYAQRWGYGWCRVVNVRAWRETDPKKVPPDPVAVGPDNFRHIREQADQAAIVVAGFGKLGGFLGKKTIAEVQAYDIAVHALKLNKDGSPQHPLYLRADAKPMPMGADL
jgi:hypothetical protein